jgi:hypothetical protein
LLWRNGCNGISQISYGRLKRLTASPSAHFADFSLTLNSFGFDNVDRRAVADGNF